MTVRRPTLAVVGATGAVGAVMLQLLSQRADVWGEIRLVASTRSAGKKLRVRGEEVAVHALSEKVFDGVDVAMFDVPDEVAARVGPDRGGPRRGGRGQLRRVPDGPRRPAGGAGGQRRHGAPPPARHRGQPQLHDADDDGRARRVARRWSLRELVVVASYQAASGAGQVGVDRLYDELEVVAGDRTLGTVAGDVRRAVADKLGETGSPFAAPLALNVVPWAGSAQDGGWTSEELKVRNESRKILGLPDLKVSATCVRVPVVTTHSLVVHATFAEQVSVEEARTTLVQAPTVVVIDDPGSGDFPTPVDVVGADPTFVGRIRQALDFPNTLELFVCGDNLRKGAALNAAQIAELLAEELTTT